MKLVVLLLIIIIIAIPRITLSQFSYKLSLESGIALNSLKLNNNRITNIYKALGSLKYKKNYQNSESSLTLKLRPEILGDNFTAIKAKAQGNYIYFGENFVSKTFVSFKHFEYSIDMNRSSISSLNIISGIETDIINNTPALIFLGYAYQIAIFSNELNSDFIYLDSKIRNSLNKYSNISYGIFIENYITKNEDNFNNTMKSKGWYYGPQVNLNYLKNILINLDYKFLFLTSKELTTSSFEHRINAAGGFRFDEKFSLFLHIDYYHRKTELETINSNSILLLPTKNENHISFKVNYKLLDNFSVYLKSGYFSENFFSSNDNIDGLNLLLGIEYKN